MSICINFNELMTLLGVMAAIISAVIGLIQYRKSNRIKKAKYLDEILDHLESNRDISEMLHLLEYNQSWYNSDFHNSYEFENKMDKTLSYLSYICYLKDSRMIEDEEFALLKYYVNHALSNRSLQKYLYNIYHYSCKILNIKSGIKNASFPFKCLFDYAEQENIFDEDFYNPYSSNYPVYLNFRT